MPSQLLRHVAEALLRRDFYAEFAHRDIGKGHQLVGLQAHPSEAGESTHALDVVSTKVGGRRMRGMWLGFGKDFTVNSGEWELDWEDGSTSPSTLRRFHDLA